MLGAPHWLEICILHAEATTAGPTALLIWASERAYGGGYPALGALAGVSRIMLYLLWFQAAWRCSRNVA